MTRSIVIASTQRGWRGGEEQARLLAEGLREQGHRVFVMARRDTPFAARMRELRFHLHEFAGKGWNPSAVFSNRRFLSRVRPDVVHINDSHALTAVSLAAVGMTQPIRFASRRVVFPIHSRLRYRLFCDALICVSQAVARVARQAGIEDARIRVVYDGVDPSRVAQGCRERGRSRLGLGERQVMLYVAALTSEKGHEVLLRSMAKIAALKDDVDLLLAGDGPCREAIERQIADAGLERQVHLLGHREDVPDLIQACDLFLFPAENEGLGSSVIDAMLAGKPVVCSDSGGTPELFSVPAEGDSAPIGWLVKNGDEPALTAAILEACSNPVEGRSRGRRAEQHARERFVAPVMVRRTLDVYEEFLATKSRRAAA